MRRGRRRDRPGRLGCFIAVYATGDSESYETRKSPYGGVGGGRTGRQRVDVSYLGWGDGRGGPLSRVSGRRRHVITARRVPPPRETATELLRLTTWNPLVAPRRTDRGYEPARRFPAARQYAETDRSPTVVTGPTPPPSSVVPRARIGGLVGTNVRARVLRFVHSLFSGYVCDPLSETGAFRPDRVRPPVGLSVL